MASVCGVVVGCWVQVAGLWGWQLYMLPSTLEGFGCLAPSQLETAGRAVLMNGQQEHKWKSRLTSEQYKGGIREVVGGTYPVIT